MLWTGAIMFGTLTYASASYTYWDGQCTACPAVVHKDKHCLQGGETVAERPCGFFKVHCEAQCRLPQSSLAPIPQIYWDGLCKPCPASLFVHCDKGGKLVTERGCGFANLFCEGGCRLPPPAPRSTDWIIVGGGAAGCAAAAALADAGEDVLVLERGSSDLDKPKTQQASTWPAVVNSDVAQPIRWNDGTWGTVANVLGGGTSLNGGKFIEEEPEFMKESFGNNFDVQQYYKSSRYVAENLSVPLQPSVFGNDFMNALSDADFGTASPDNPSLRSFDGAFVPYSTINTSARGWPRRSAAELLHDRAHLKNLRYFTGYQVNKILFKNQTATGVSVRTSYGDVSTVEARKGVILAAGAIFTPQLLQISGIGDEALLRNLNVQLVVNNSAVGQNFIDRNVLSVGALASKTMPLFLGYAIAVNKTLGLTLEAEGWGKVASEFAIASLAFNPPNQRTQTLRQAFDALLKLGISDVMDNMILLVALQHHTRSRGNVAAISTDASQPPSVTANYFADSRDLDEQMVALKALLRILETQPMQRYTQNKSSFQGVDSVPNGLHCLVHTPKSHTTAVVVPCLPVKGSSTAQVHEYLRNALVSSYHYFGTAAYGTVVEGQEFRVKGVQHLHIVDASVFPKPTVVNPQGAIMALGHSVGTRLAMAGVGV